MHVVRGHLALADGSVAMVNTFGLRDAITAMFTAGITNVVISKPQGLE